MRITTLVDLKHPQSNGKLIANEFKRQGHQVQLLDYHHNERVILKKVCEFNPHIIFGTHTHKALSASTSLKLKTLPKHPLMALWYCDGYSPLEKKAGKYFHQTRGIYDIAFVTVKGLVPEFNQIKYARKVIWTPQYFDNTFFVPNIKRTNKYDVCFLGNIYPAVSYRKDYIAALEKRYKVLKGGKGLGKQYYGTECANFYMQAKIAIDIPSACSKYDLSFSDRIYRALGHGCLFISQKVKGIEELFIPNKHIVMYDNTIESLCSKIDYYLKHDNELKKIAIEGQREVLAKHTISIRVREYLQHMSAMLQRRIG